VSRELLLEGVRRVRLREQPPRSPGAREVRVGALLSGISHGTELSLYRGASAFDEWTFDRTLRAFVAAHPTAPPYPARLGYELVGRVDEVGDEVHELEMGDLVHVGTPHREEVLVDLDAAARSTYPPVRLPPDQPLERWLFVSLGAVALVAVHDARIKLGDHVVVVGLGAIGLLLVQMVRMAGATAVTAVEPVPARRELALQLGADRALSPEGWPDGVGAAIKRDVGGADVSIDTSGVDAGLHAATTAAGLGGTVVTAGFYQGGAPNLRLGEEWHHNRLDMVSSMGAWGAPHRNHPAWDRPRVMRTVVELLASGRVQVDALPVRRFPFREAVGAYRWLDEHPNDAVKVVLTYDGTDPGGGEG
jgi:2-desacetyl-2-hydroxyethyl bacteriochlorophyllide A dehydrogenase